MERELEQTLALAGIAQSCFMVRQLAHNGVAAADKLSTSVNSLFVTDPKTTLDVFGGRSTNLNQGLQILQEIFEGNSSVFSADQVLRYIMSVLHLLSHLKKRPDMLEQIGNALQNISERYPERPYSENQELIRALANVYQETLSTLPFRIQVSGDMQRLQNDFVAARVRVLLFAAVRSAVLWDQRGGRRWHLIFLRKRISRHVNRLLLKPE